MLNFPLDMVLSVGHMEIPVLKGYDSIKLFPYAPLLYNKLLRNSK